MCLILNLRVTKFSIIVSFLWCKSREKKQYQLQISAKENWPPVSVIDKVMEKIKLKVLVFFNVFQPMCVVFPGEKKKKNSDIPKNMFKFRN